MQPLPSAHLIRFGCYSGRYIKIFDVSKVPLYQGRYIRFSAEKLMYLMYNCTRIVTGWL